MEPNLPPPPQDDEVDAPANPAAKPPGGAGSPPAAGGPPKPGAPPAKPPANVPPTGGPDKGTPEARNLPPVGDIQLSKVKGTYNTYKMEISYGQLEAVRSALEKDHADPVSDELLQIMSYYMDKLPGPGEEEEDIKARDEAAKNGTAGLEDDDDAPLPAPPGMEDDGADAGPGNPAPGMDDDLGGGGEDHMPPPRSKGGLPEAPGGGASGADERLEEPPAE